MGVGKLTKKDIFVGKLDQIYAKIVHISYGSLKFSIASYSFLQLHKTVYNSLQL